MRTKIISLLGCLVMTLIPLSASATIINFDSLSVGNIDGVDLGGVILTSPDGSTEVFAPPTYSGGYISSPNVVTNSGFLQGTPLSATFASLVSYVSVTGGDNGGDLDQFQITAFDLLNNIITTVMSPVFGGNPVGGLFMNDNYTLTVNAAGIKRVEFLSIGPVAGIGIDDLTFDQVPEPATLALMGLGLAGLGFTRRKKA